MALSFNELFLSSQQSKWTGIAIVCAIIAICLSILFNNNDLLLNERFALIFIIILFSIPAVLISLFELNCISTKNNSHNWCSYWGWFIFAIITLQCILIIISALMSMITYNEATNKIVKYKDESNVSKENADKLAKDMINVPKSESTNSMDVNSMDVNTMDVNTMDVNTMDTNIMGYNMDTSYMMPLAVEQFKNKKSEKKETEMIESFKNKKSEKKEIETETESIEGFVNGGEFASF